MSLKGMNVTNPSAFIGIIILVLLAVELVSVGLPQILKGLWRLSLIENFTFKDFFAADGLMELVVGAIILLGILGIMGVKAYSSSKR